MDSEPPRHAQRAPGHIWRFGECEFDERRRELRVRGATVDIEVKPLEVLHQLLLHAGEVVTKGELLESVWPGVAVVDGSLATAVSKVRKLLGDDDRLIVTVPRIGYKLAVPVQCKPVAGAPEPDLRFVAGERVPGRDQWRLTRRLDPSPSSEVWLAEHPKTRETRVFKFAVEGERLRCLKREVTVARLLREALGERGEFVRVLEWNFDAPPYYIESEYGGPNLAQWADAQGGLPNVQWEIRLKLLVDVAQAVAAAHALDLLHKDLKPGNVLIASTPEGAPQIKLADFGSASLLLPARLSALGITNLGFTQSGAGAVDSLTGTPIYLAPEVLAGQSPTAASDVYALGVLLYQLVVGDFRRPFAPGWEADVADPLLRDDIAMAASGDPARRFQSAAELVHRLLNLNRRRAEAGELAAAQQRAEAAERRRASVLTVRRRLALAGVIVLVAATGWSVYRRSASATPRIRTVAVLPFQHVGSDPGVDFLRLALPDEIATTLSHAQGLAVRPFAITRRYDEANVNLQQAGQETGAGTIVTGHFVKAAEQLHITLEAIDLDTNRVLWRDNVDAPADNLIAAHVQIALKIRGGLAPAVGASVMDAPTQPKNNEAYELFLRNIALTLDPEPNPTGIGMLERAVELDPTYPPAWLALARRYYVEARYRTGDAGLMDRYDAAMERAYELDPAYVAAGAGLLLRRIERGDLIGAHERAQDLVRRHPDSVDAHFSLSYVLRFAGLLEEAASHCETAFLLDPRTLTSGLRSCAIVFLLRADYPRASNYLNLDRGSAFAKAMSIDMLVREGKHQEAVAIGSPQMPQWPSYDLLLGCIQRRPAAEIDALAATVRPSDDPEANYLSAAHLAYCGQTEAAIEMLRRAIDGNYCSYPAVDSDPLLTNLRARPQFDETRAAAMECQKAFLAQRGQRGRLNTDSRPTGSASNACCSGSIPSARLTIGSGTRTPTGSSLRDLRALSTSRQIRATTVVSQPPRFSTPPASVRLSRSQDS